MRKPNKNKSRAWRLIVKVSALGKSRAYGKECKLISSINTQKSYQSAISQYLDWRDENNLPEREQDKFSDLTAFLSEISEIFMQQTVDQYTSALSIVFKKKLPKFKSEIPKNNQSRNYFLSEVLRIIKNLESKNAIAILLCYFSGLRAHEIATIRRLGEIKKSTSRKWSPDRFNLINSYKIYLVQGKGGLIREVAIPNELSEVIEKRRLETPVKVIDRGIYYETFYELGYGKALSQCFSRSSKKLLNWTTGLHGLRHSYAQNRIYSLIDAGISFNSSLKIISEELGHFRPKVTLCYLR